MNFEPLTPCLPLDPESSTVSFHNFKSQKIELSISNPRSKYVAYWSVRSLISNCQSLGRKNKHEKLTVLWWHEELSTDYSRFIEGGCSGNRV